MKPSVLIALIFTIAACNNGDVKSNGSSAMLKDSTKFTSIQWIDSVKNIGTIEAGKKTQINFKFKNTGSKPLFIISAEPGCGCTIADYPKEAIVPGGEGNIKADFHTNNGTTGEFRKNIHVTTNTKGTTSHYIFFYGVIKNAGDSLAVNKIDTATLEAIKSKELKRNLLLKPNKN